MGTRVFVLLSMFYSVTACAIGGRLGSIRPGMTRTDVMVELGKPAEIRIDQETTFWLYPSSPTEVCMIKFVEHKVAADSMKCESTESTRKLATEWAGSLDRMNSEKEYQLRLLRYCGVRPSPEPGCRISEACINGAWEETCENSPK